ncbi:MAG TPA: Rieske 2Fe-2S domain-containing protein [Candidatus Binataceae bacterium]|nr:Rieske 2Fe-2S domain-containing protein [Candidatus Binataceae bacterium]
MATPRESEILTRVGPGTPMGNLMRQYWIPAAMSWELAADGDPMRLMLLGERLIAFRDSTGRVGVMDHRCPHRCASLFFGRNEQGGLRCVYHGWKFGADGSCLEMPNVPPEYDYKHKVRARAYPVHEQAGLIWVYMGPRPQPPAFPAMEPFLLPESELELGFTQRECNYLQALEGDIDTTHLSFLHLGGIKAEELAAGDINRFTVANRQAELHVRRASWGTMYGARREVDGKVYWRFAQFLFPFWTMIPTGNLAEHVFARGWVPMDDTHTMIVRMVWKGGPRVPRLLRDGRAAAGTRASMTYLPNSTDWFGRWRVAANAGNDYQIDRESQRTNSFTGIDGIPLQDQAVTESMGPITDHSWEHLGHSDVMIIQTRRRLLEAAVALEQQQVVPPGVEDPEIFLAARGGDFALEQDLDWLEAYAGQMRRAVDPTGRLVDPTGRLQVEETAPQAQPMHAK